MKMNIRSLLAALAFVALAPTSLFAEPHPGKESIEASGYEGPVTCENCHPGKAKEFLSSVHWKHASPVTNVEGLDPSLEYGMLNRIYTMCNGNDVVNNLKQTPQGEAAKAKFTGCNTCHPGNHLSDVGSSGTEAENAIDCLVCHSADYDFTKRVPYRDEQDRVVMGQDRSVKAALSVGRPATKNCMVCHERAGGGIYVKRGFEFTKKNDVHAARGMTCVDCHKAENHRIPTGFDPNTWANDGVRVSCNDCHGAAPHEDEDYNRHTSKIACQTCHITHTGGTMAKDFTRWEQATDKFYEPATIQAEANSTRPAYAWYNQRVRNTPRFIGPAGSRTDGKSKIYPFKVFQGKAFFDKTSGQLLSMDFAPPMANGDALAGVASAARTLGIKTYEATPGWQTLYFGSSHLVTRDGALTCVQCHAVGGALNFKDLGYADKEISRLTNPEIYFDNVIKKQKEDW
jgi:hypothetical protein